MVPMNLFAGQEQRCRHREQSWDQPGEEGMGRAETEALTFIHHHV